MTQSTVLVVEDDATLREALTDTLELAGYRVLSADSGQGALAELAKAPVQLVVSDVQMAPLDGHALLKRIKVLYGELPVVLVTAYGTVEKAVQAMQNGAADYLVKPFAAQTLLEVVQRHIQGIEEDDDLIAADVRTRELAELARRVAATEATVMITGESGTGKEVFARYIHRHSPRAGGPFVAINCAAIPENMLEAVLFGYEKGAFTGAYQACAGKFEQAQGGTLLLDEISEMDLGLQAKLLRVLQEREVERLGGQKVVVLNVRVLATSNRVMRDEVAAGRFREDLFYRLNVFPLHLPPLRERPADVVPLARRMVRTHSGRGVTLSDEAAAALSAHTWPGNVRELDNVVQRALILLNGREIAPEHLHFEAAPLGGAAACAQVEGGVLGDDLKAHEHRLIIDALSAGNGSRKAAAARLGISERTLRYKLARLKEQGVPIPASFGLKTA